jgi:hypothetical protein
MEINKDGKNGDHGVLCEAVNPLDHCNWMFVKENMRALNPP